MMIPIMLVFVVVLLGVGSYYVYHNVMKKYQKVK